MTKVRIIIAGGRDFNDYLQLRDTFTNFMAPYKNSEVTVISGMAKGADTLGIQIAKQYGLPVIEMPANWDHYGKSAGHIRNAEMAKIGTHLLAAWDGKSKGTKGMIDISKKLKLEIRIMLYKK